MRLLPVVPVPRFVALLIGATRVYLAIFSSLMSNSQ